MREFNGKKDFINLLLHGTRTSALREESGTRICQTVIELRGGAAWQNRGADAIIRSLSAAAD